MKNLFSLILFATAVTVVAQPKKAPKMAPVLASGYYTNQKGDTVRGEVQTNPEDETEFYRSFSFKPAKGGKVMPVDSKKAKSYGFDGKHFTLIPYNGAEVYAEYLVRGRLTFMEYKMHDKKDGEEIIGSVFFIQDAKADEAEKELRELKPISQKFYKRDLRPYMKAQSIIWDDMDKFTFSKNSVVNALKEFNKFYEN
jgi:hypothetical protein